MIFTSFALRRVRLKAERTPARSKLPQSPARTWASTVVLVVGLTVVMFNSYESSTELMTGWIYVKHQHTREFMRRLQGDSKRALEEHGAPLPIVDEPLPRHAGTRDLKSAVQLLELMGVNVVPAIPGQAAYRVSESGALTSAHLTSSRTP